MIARIVLLLSLLYYSSRIIGAHGLLVKHHTAVRNVYLMTSSSSKILHSTTKLSSKSSAETQFITNKMCPYAQKAWIALESSGIPYELREVSLYGPGGKPDWFWKLNPRGTVPVVTMNGGNDVYADSELILDAVGDISEGILTRTSDLSDEERTQVSKWRDIVSKKLTPIGKSAVLGGSMPKLRSLLKEMNDVVVLPYLVGERMTLADCAVFPFLWRIDQDYGIGSDGEEKLREWLNTCLKTETIKGTVVRSWWWWW
jgi:glutathione S-transferase